MKIALSTFALVFLRAIQQQNVIHGNYVMAAITPFAIAAAEVLTVIWMVDIGPSSIPMVGAGGACGVILAMALHRKIRRIYDGRETRN